MSESDLAHSIEGSRDPAATRVGGPGRYPLGVARTRSPTMPEGSLVRKSAAVAADDDYFGEFHVYEPHRAGLPKMGPYFRELWRRREFASELAASTIRSNNSDSVLGILWNVLNPLLLAGVYYLLVVVLSSNKTLAADYFPHLLAGLFAFYFVAGCMTGGATAVTSSGKIIMNTAFPRILLPLSAVWIAVRKFLPTMIVYIAIVLLWPNVSLHWGSFLAIPMFFLIAVFGAGMAMLLATATVYFRDTSSFLPYVSRIWLYVSPVLYYPETIKSHTVLFIERFNPLFSLLGGWGDLLVRGKMLTATMWLQSGMWSALSLLIGGLFFMSRERDFAVRL